MSRTERQQHGTWAEDTVQVHLERAGLRTLERNWQCRTGEIDLIMQYQEVIVFVEVRYRKRNDYGGALASVDRRKQQRLTRAAQAWLQRRRRGNPPAARFDVVTVASDGNIDWRPAAFEAG